MDVVLWGKITLAIVSHESAIFYGLWKPSTAEICSNILDILFLYNAVIKGPTSLMKCSLYSHRFQLCLKVAGWDDSTFKRPYFEDMKWEFDSIRLRRVSTTLSSLSRWAKKYKTQQGYIKHYNDQKISIFTIPRKNTELARLKK